MALFTGLLILLAACTAPSPAPPIPATPPVSTTAPTTLPPRAIERLVVWLPDWMWQDKDAATVELADTFSAFESAHGVKVEVVRKPAVGAGGLLEFLTTSAAVAPAILPDVVVLPLPDAERAAAAGLFQPLDGLLGQDLETDLFPFAQDAARTEAGWFAVPFAAWFEHLAFRPAALTDPPVNWDTVQTASGTYAFPAAGLEAGLTDALLVHYLSSVSAGEDPLRNERALRRTLTFYEQARAGNRIDSSTLSAAGPAETFPRVVEGQAVMAHVDTGLWRGEGTRAPGLGYGPVPTADGVPRAIGRGWALAMVTPDAERQVLSARLIEQMLAPERLAPWSQAARLLPARRSALAAWPATGYAAFAREGLETAIRPPAWIGDTPFVASLHRATLDVLAGTSDVETALRAAAETW